MCPNQFDNSRLRLLLEKQFLFLRRRGDQRSVVIEHRDIIYHRTDNLNRFSRWGKLYKGRQAILLQHFCSAIGILAYTCAQNGPIEGLFILH